MRIAYLDGDVNGQPDYWWLRSPHVNLGYRAQCVDRDGHVYDGYWFTTDSYGRKASPRTDNYHDACIVYGDGDVHDDYGNDVRYSSCGILFFAS